MLLNNRKVNPQKYERAGFEVKSYFNFGDFIDPRHDVPLTIVQWRIIDQEIMNARHPNYDLVTVVRKGIHRQDNHQAQNNQIKEGFISVLINDDQQNEHSDSNASEDVTQLIQIFIKQQKQKNASFAIFNKIVENEEYKIYTINEVQEIRQNGYKYTFLINLVERNTPFMKISSNIIKKRIY
ncbi:hypothetical protein pb186bvf_008723 [Paramecium bursaria]